MRCAVAMACGIAASADCARTDAVIVTSCRHNVLFVFGNKRHPRLPSFVRATRVDLGRAGGGRPPGWKAR
jgi:hypothetical protein